MNNEQREQLMMADAEAYAAEIYIDEPDDFSKDEQLCETINDFCAGWRAADKHPNWISVEDELPTIPEKWYCIEVLFRTKDSTNYLGKYFGDKWISYEDHTFRTEDITHWMPIIPPRKEEGNE